MKRAASVLALLSLAACGGSDTPTTPARPVPSIAGRYQRWDALLVQWNRANDGVSGSFTCQGSLTISQTEGVAGISAITGFLVISSPCRPQSFDLNGTVDADGKLHFFTGGPKPPVGQCPAVNRVEYSGVVVIDTDGRGTSAELSARGTANINCPGPGEGPQRMDYFLQGYRD